MRTFFIAPIIACLAVQGVASAQAVTQQPETARVDTTPLTPGQEKYLDGLKTAGRGVAQLKDGVNQIARAAGTRDSTKLRQAGHRLGGLCGAARGFLVNGRSTMNANVFTDATRKTARDLAFRVDSLSAGSKACEHSAAKDPGQTANDLLNHIRGYEGALASFRTAIGLPNRSPTVPAAIQSPPPPKP